MTAPPATPPAPGPDLLPRAIRSYPPKELHRGNPALLALLAETRNPLEQLSASALKDDASCRRLFWLRHVAGIRPDWSSAAADAGTAIHNEHEDHHVKGSAVEHPSLIDAQQKGHVPPRGEPHWRFEEEFWLELPLAVPGTAPTRPVLLHGFIDICRIPPADVGRVAYVRDFKTKADRQKAEGYALSPAKLRTDVQMQIYALWILDAHPWIDEVTVAHIYLAREPDLVADDGGARLVGHSKMVTATFTRARDLGTLWKHVVALVEDTVTTAHAAGTWDAATPDWSSCEDYSGCPFEMLCWDRHPSDTLDIDTLFDDDAVEECCPTCGATTCICGPTEDPVPSPTANQPFPGLNPPDGVRPGTAPSPQQQQKEKPKETAMSVDLMALLGTAGTPAPTTPKPPAAPPPILTGAAAPAAGNGGDIMALLNMAGTVAPAAPKAPAAAPTTPAVATAPAAAVTAAVATAAAAVAADQARMQAPNPADLIPATSPVASTTFTQADALRLREVHTMLQKLCKHLGVQP